MEQDSVNQRLNLIVDTFENGKKAAFARKAGISPQGAQELLAGRKGDPSFKVLVKILESYPTVDANWLVLGRGVMLREEGVGRSVLTPEEEKELLELEESNAAANERLELSIEELRKQLMAVVNLTLSSEQAEKLKQDFPASFPPIGK